MEWEKFISVEAGWTTNLLATYESKEADRVVMRSYSVHLDKLKYSTDNFVEFIKNSIKTYVLSKTEIEEELKNGNDPLEYALQYFGKIDPTYDGKYGELILYLMVEDILKIPMVVFKIPSNAKDQIKGSDGIFCGDYNGVPAILLGESKTWKTLSGALRDAFKSLNKFYSDEKILKFEYMVAKKSIRRDLTADDLNSLYQCFSYGSEEYKKRIKVHPVLILYNNKKLGTTVANRTENIDEEIKGIIEKSLNTDFKKIESLRIEFEDVAKVYLDFFFIPMDNIDVFRKDLYKSFHGEPWA